MLFKSSMEVCYISEKLLDKKVQLKKNKVFRQKIHRPKLSFLWYNKLSNRTFVVCQFLLSDLFCFVISESCTSVVHWHYQLPDIDISLCISVWRLRHLVPWRRRRKWSLSWNRWDCVWPRKTSSEPRLSARKSTQSFLKKLELRSFFFPQNCSLYSKLWTVMFMHYHCWLTPCRLKSDINTESFSTVFFASNMDFALHLSFSMHVDSCVKQ